MKNATNLIILKFITVRLIMKIDESARLPNTLKHKSHLLVLMLFLYKIFLNLKTFFF